MEMGKRELSKFITYQRCARYTDLRGLGFMTLHRLFFLGDQGCKFFMKKCKNWSDHLTQL